MKQGKGIKNVSEMNNRDRVGKNLSDMILIRNVLKQWDVLSPFLFNYALEIPIRRVQVNGTHQLLAYADDVNRLRGSVHTIKEDAEALIVASKEIGLKVNVDQTKYMFMSRDQNAG